MGSTRTESSPRRWIGLDGLRGLAAVAVLVLHASMYSNPGRPPGTATDVVFRSGHLGVTLFFVLSGFLLFAPWARAASDGTRAPGLAGYAVRRAARVFPAYWFALAGAALLLAGTGSSHALRPEHIPILLTAQQDLVVTTPAELIPPAWTLGIEITFYAALPLLGLALVRWVRRPRAQLLACAGLFAGSIAFNVWVHAGGVDGRWHSTLFGDLYAFAAGMGATVVAARFTGPRGLVVGFGAALVVLNALLHDPIGWTALDSLRDAPAALGFALLVVGLADSPVLGSAPLRWLGDRSFGLYLWHYPVIAALAVRGWMPSSLVGLLAIVLPVSLLAGHVSWVLLERPLAARARRLRRPVRRRTRWAPAPARA